MTLHGIRRLVRLLFQDESPDSRAFMPGRILEVPTVTAVLMALFFCCIPAGAEDGEWSLERCIEYALKNNLQIRQQELSVIRDRNLLQKAKLDYIPSFDASLNENLNWGRSVDLKNLEIIDDALSTSTSASLNASIMLFDGLSKVFALKEGGLTLEISLSQVEKLKCEMSIQITKAYLQVLLSHRILEISRASLESISRQRDRTAALVEAGSQPYSALLDMEAQLSSERVQYASASGTLKTDILNLTQLLDLDEGTEFSVFIPDEDSIDAGIGLFQVDDAEAVYDGALGMPVIRCAELSLEKSVAEYRSTKWKYCPTISFSASYGTYYASNTKDQYGDPVPFFDQVRYNVNPAVGFGLTIPIFNSGVRSDVKNAELEVKRRELELRSSRQTLFKEIQQAVTEAGSRYEKMEAARVNLLSVTESFRHTEEKFEAGAVSSTDYVVSKTSLQKARSEYYQARYQLVFQLKIIDFYRGIPITL